MTPEDRSLLLDYLSDDLTDQELERLVARLKRDERLAEQLLSIAGDEARLVEWARAAAVEPVQQPLATASVGAEPASVQAGQSVKETPVNDPPLVALAKPTRILDWRSMAVIAATCAATVLAVVLLRPNAFEPVALPTSRVGTSDRGGASENTRRSVVARVVNESSDSEWYTERLSHQDPWSLHRGDVVRLNAGSLRIRYDHGTSMTIQAPAVLELTDAMHARMHRGAIRVVVAKGSEGFSVATPIARVVDLGTEFGVRVNDRGGTDVVVFEGAVDVEGRANELGPPTLARRLNAGQAVRVDELGTASRIVTVQSDRFPASIGESLELPTDLRQPVIRQVLDNIDRENAYSFYEIVQSGMREDALAFVDRPEHQWNGVDANGMPDYLLQGDLVRTFNDDKLNKHLQITLEIAQPADIYILLDDRADVPVWLEEEFERTPDQLGLDEGSGKYRDLAPDGSIRWAERPTGTGPGVSIDFTCSIWRRSVSEAGPVVLGSLGGDNWDINMYGIVVSPQED